MDFQLARARAAGSNETGPSTADLSPVFPFRMSRAGSGSWNWWLEGATGRGEASDFMQRVRIDAGGAALGARGTS